MDNLKNLITIIEKMVEEEKAKGTDIKCLEKSHAPLIAQIVSNYKLQAPTEAQEKSQTQTESQESLQVSTDAQEGLQTSPEVQEKPKAEMIFIGAPTGAGKDTLVRKIILDNNLKQFVVLNMDMFRYYYCEISGDRNKILDKDFAVVTNQISYEIYYIIQEIILREFPGTDVIITGTIKDLEWVKQIVARYKQDPKTQYKTSLITLAVPERESAFSIFERYLNLVDTRGNTGKPLRYTELKYHNDTVKDFILNVKYFENQIKSKDRNVLFDTIKVYRRNKDMFDVSENNIIYDSENANDEDSAIPIIDSIMKDNVQIDYSRIEVLLRTVEKNKDYLTAQGLYSNILSSLNQISGQKNTEDYKFEK